MAWRCKQRNCIQMLQQEVTAKKEVRLKVAYINTFVSSIVSSELFSKMTISKVSSRMSRLGSGHGLGWRGKLGTGDS